jgi:hypothetical protein
MTGVQLKALCKEQGLKVAGKKADLQDRLREHFLTSSHSEAEDDEFDSMSDEELRLSLAGRDLGASGDRAALLARLREDIAYIRDLETAIPPDEANGYKTISEALEAAAKKGGAAGDILAHLQAKSAEEPKWVDVTITSLGMQPDKYTAGGAPSCTADVLRKLAGDPYEEPPNYGLVRNLLPSMLRDKYLSPFDLGTNSSARSCIGIRLFWRWRRWACSLCCPL